MTIGVNNNFAASVARRQLHQTGQDLATARIRLATGLKVTSAKDNGAIFAIATSERAKHAGYTALQRILDQTSGVLDTALAGVGAISEQVRFLQKTIRSAAALATTQDQHDAYNAAFTTVRDRIDNITRSAEFNGANLIDGSTNLLTVPAGFDRSENFYIGGYDLTLAGSFLNFGPATELPDDNPLSIAADIAVSLGNLEQIEQQFAIMSRRMEIHSNFIFKVADSVGAGIGNLVDADIGYEAARIAALQAKQQLGSQSLSIANTAAVSILSYLF